MHVLLLYNSMNLNFFGDISFRGMRGMRGRSPYRSDMRSMQKKHRWFDTLFCGICAAPTSEPKKECHKDAAYILGAAGRYDDDALRALIHALKFQESRMRRSRLPRFSSSCRAARLRSATVLSVTHTFGKTGASGGSINRHSLLAPFAEALGLPFKAHLLTRTQHQKTAKRNKRYFERRGKYS